MLKKIISIIKATLIMWVCIVVPLFLAIRYIESSFSEDTSKYIDVFMKSEASSIAQNLSLQFEKTEKEIDELCLELQHIGLDNAKDVQNSLTKIVGGEPDVSFIKLYKSDGSFFAGSKRADAADLSLTASLKKIGHNLQFNIEQQADSSIVVKYITTHKFENEDFFIEVSLKWDVYEKWLKKLQRGNFPRMFYITSPDCKRYVSCNVLPEKSKNNNTLIALGLHLASKQKAIKDGITNVTIDRKLFRVCKQPVTIPANMTGHKFYAIVATDDSAKQYLSHGIERVYFSMALLVGIWLGLCLVIARVFGKAKEQVEISSTITDSTPLAVAIFNAATGKLMRINASGSSLFRVSHESMNNLNMWDIFISDDDRQYMKNAAASNIQVLNYEVLMQSFGGGVFWAICSSSAIQIRERSFIVLAALDINGRKEIEKKLAQSAATLEQEVANRTADLNAKAKELEESYALLEKAKAMAESANEAKSRFLTSMSNQFKTPVNAIVGYSEILKEEALERKDNVSAEDLQKILGSAKHLLSLIDEILDLSKIEAGKTSFTLSNIEVGSMIKEIEGVSMPLITENDNSLFIEYPKDIGIMYTDPTKLRQCLLNVISNAAKFTQFGKVTLRAAPIVKEGIDFIEFTVIDTGAGIPADKLDDIFTSFQNDKQKAAVSGLGLSITKKYIEQMGGSISVDSEVGVGSRFTLKFPRVSAMQSSDTVHITNDAKNEDSLDQEFLDEEESYVLSQSKDATVFARKSDENL